MAWISAAASVTFWMLVVFALSQVWFVIRVVVVMRRARRRVEADGPLPKAAVILCVRGPDPFLEATIEGLLRQDYPSYDLRIVVDHGDDPAWRIVEEVLRRHPGARVEVAPLRERRETGSLKCSSLVQAVRGLDPSHEIVALADADTIPHPSWLRDFALTLSDPKVGVATGNRWYMPREPSWGALVRYLWNAGAFISMLLHRIPWGGSLALKTRLFQETDLLDRWAGAFCEDTMLYSVLKARGLRVRFVPSLVMINRETSRLRPCFRWIQRQLLAARLYHPGFLAAAIYGLLCTAALVAATALAVAALATRQWDTATRLAGALAGFLALQVFVVGVLEMLVRRVAATRDEPTRWLTPWTLLRLLPAIPVTQVVYAAALVSSFLVRRVRWRGVVYQIGPCRRVRMQQYRPFSAQPSGEGTAASL